MVITLSYSSCKKDEVKTVDNDDDVTFELSSQQAISDNLEEDAQDVLIQTSVENNFSGNTKVTFNGAEDISGCATVTVSPLEGFPKNITIDFGDGCTSVNGVERKGIIHLVVSDFLIKSGSTSVMTFENYSVNGFKKEGTITWTNKSSATIKTWERKSEAVKITAPSGKSWQHSGVRIITQTEGSSTVNILDDVFSITGNSTISNSAGKTRTCTIETPLVKKVVCANISKGSIKVEGGTHSALIDFGNGDCDKMATISIDGKDAVTFLLRD